MVTNNVLEYHAEQEALKEFRKRKGIIRVSKQLIETMDLKSLKLLFSNFYVINVNMVEFGDIEYYGFSEHFDIVNEECVINKYVVSINTEKQIIEFEKV